MVVVFKQALYISAIAVVILLTYCIITELIDSLKNKRDIKNEEYRKDFFEKIKNTILIFFPMFFLIFSLIFWINEQITA